jgi:hypothetical protein
MTKRRKIAEASQSRNYSIEIIQYYLSIYPCETNPPSGTGVLAYMTLMGTPAAGNTTPNEVNFYINFYADGTPGLSAPGIGFDGAGNVRIILDMYYSQLATLLDSLNNQLQRNGPICALSYTDGPPLHAEFIVAVPPPKLPVQPSPIPVHPVPPTIKRR